ncbi:MAG: tetratricopeptide repeat protein, partial [Planctomycetota bacterium]
ALAAGVPSRPEERFKVLFRAAHAANMTGDPEAEERFNAEMFSLAADSGNRQWRAAALRRRGHRLYSISEFDSSIETYAEMLRLSEELQDDDLREDAERGLGINFNRLGRHAEALQHHQASLEFCRRNGDRAAQAGAHSNIAIQLVNLGKLAAAEKHYERAVRLARESGERRWEANATANWGKIHFENGDYDRAWDCATRFREITRLIGDRRGEATSGVILSTLWMLFGAIEEMEHELNRIEVWIEETRDRWLSGYAVRQRAWIALQRGDWEAAERLYIDAIALRRELGDLNSLADTLTELGTMLIARGRASEGTTLLHEALSMEQDRGMDASYPVCALCVVEPERIADARRMLEQRAPRGLLSVLGPYQLWRGGGDRKDLEAAHDALLDLESRIPMEYRRSSRERVRQFREVAEEWDKLSS